MAQPSVAAFFCNRKRAAVDDAITAKSRRLAEESKIEPPKEQPGVVATEPLKSLGMRTRSGRSVKLVNLQASPAVKAKKQTKTETHSKQQKLEQFMKKGMLEKSDEPTTSLQALNEKTPRMQNPACDEEIKAMRTPTKQILKAEESQLNNNELKRLVSKELTFDEVKTKVSRSAKLQELKASLARIQQLEQTRKAQEERNRRLREAGPSPAKKAAPAVTLKEFHTIELEVLTSPSKTFKTPTKLPPPTPDKHELMSPRHTDVSKRLVFSPAKPGSPVHLVVPPAYQRFMSLAESSKAGQLPLPYKYRHLMEIFKGVDSVVAMFHNRKECITFKKLKPAVQRMLRKNFTEMHLAQIKHIYPEAFLFSQMKMRNYGSVSKADYFQLVISPNVDTIAEESPAPAVKKINEDDVLASAQSMSMNPHVITARMQRFHLLLLERVREEHDKFIRSLDPPLIIGKHKVTRWHPEFDLESCPEVERGALPQPPNVEKYSSAKDILSTARNLFNCATPMERAMQRYEEAQTATLTSQPKETDSKSVDTSTNTAKPTVKSPQADTVPGTGDITANLLKGLPKSLIEKIRAKQAAKALEAMTRRPSQDQEATKYSRLPELARHLRNVFVTERKGVLTLEIVIKKIQNSFRASLSPQEIETHLKLLAKEVPAWVGFHEVRKTMYLKIAKEMDMNKIIEQLENVANNKSK